MFIQVYKKRGKTNISKFRNVAGVYLIKKNNKIIYIGHSAKDVYKTATRHFQDWNDKTQIRVTYPQTKDYKIRVIPTRPNRAMDLERYLIKKLKPKDNPEKYENYKLDLPKETIEKFEEAPF